MSARKQDLGRAHPATGQTNAGEDLPWIHGYIMNYAF